MSTRITKLLQCPNRICGRFYSVTVEVDYDQVLHLHGAYQCPRCLCLIDSTPIAEAIALIRPYETAERAESFQKEREAQA